MHPCVVLFGLLCGCFLGYQAYKLFRTKKIKARTLTLVQFLKELMWNYNQGNIITCIGIDRPDADNFTAVLLLLQQLKKNMGKNLIPLCIFLTGRPFDPNSPPCVKLPNGMIKYMDENGKVYIVSGKEFFSNPNNIIQKPNFVSHKKFAKILHEIFAGQLRLFLESNDFIEGIHYFLFNGGIPPLAGINSFIHVIEMFMTKQSENGEYNLPTADEINDLNNMWFDMTLEQRKEYIEEEHAKYGTNTMMNKMDQFFMFCRSNPGKHIVCYGAGPLTPFYTFPIDIANRVVLFQLMGGVFNGMTNILGGCFNNMVDFPEPNQVNLFKNARTIYLTTEVCKWSSLLPTKELLDAIQEIAGFNKLSCSFRKWVEQWNDIKKSPQAMFDLLAVMPLDVLFNIYGSISRVKVDINESNPKIPNDPVFGNMSFKIIPTKIQAIHETFSPGDFAFDYLGDYKADEIPFIKAVGKILS